MALCILVISFLDFILLLFIEIIKILVILIVGLLAGLSLSLGPLFLVLGVLHLLLGGAGDGPQGLAGGLGLSRVICDHHVVEDGARLDLPQVEADLTALRVLADILGVIGIVLRVVNLWVHPLALVVGVVNLPWLPLSLVLRVVNHGRLPLSVHLIVPVLGLCGIGVGGVLGLVPVLWLDILRIIKLGLVNPVVGLLRFRILDCLGRQEIPVISQRSGLSGLVVNQHLVCPVSVDNQGVEMGEDVVLATDVLLDQVVLPLVLKDHVHLLGARSANIRSKHDVVWRFSMHVSLVELAVEKLDVATTAVDVLLVLYGELDHQRFVHIGDWGEGSAHAVEPCVLARPGSLVQLLISVELASF